MVPCSSIHLAYISLAAHIQYIDILYINKFIGKNGSLSQNLIIAYHGLMIWKVTVEKSVESIYKNRIT